MFLIERGGGASSTTRRRLFVIDNGFAKLLVGWRDFISFRLEV